MNTIVVIGKNLKKYGCYILTHQTKNLIKFENSQSPYDDRIIVASLTIDMFNMEKVSFSWARLCIAILNTKCENYMIKFKVFTKTLGISPEAAKLLKNWLVI